MSRGLGDVYKRQTQTYMIPGFESVLTAQKNVPFVLKTNYGVHVVEVTKTTAPILKKKVALLVKETLASKETFQAAYAKANQFAVMAAGKYENYRKAVDSLGVYSHPVNNMIEGTDRLGAIENTKEVARWAYENKVGKVSNIITVDNAYFIIATVRGIHKEGYATVKEVASSIKQQLYYEKLAEKKAAEVAEKINGLNDLQAIAEKLGTTVSTQSGVAFSSMTSQGLDPKFIGAVSVAPVVPMQARSVRVVAERNHDEPFSRAARTALRRSLDPATPWIVPRLACAGIEDSPDPCSIIALRFRRNVKSAMSGQNLLTQKTTPPYNQPILPIDRIVCNRIERRRNHV